MSTTVTQPGIPELLETAGARPRGNRHDCPRCGGARTVTHADETFFCHKCQWKGNSATLAKELGIHQRIPSAEYRELRQRRERAHKAALKLYQAARDRQLELREQLRELGRAELVAHEAGPDNPSTWQTLSRVYTEGPAIERELDALESGNADTVFEHLTRSP